MSKIADLRAFEILDSRGNPTVRVDLWLDSGAKVSASVPSGASTGENEAVELRDGDPKRYKGKGVLKACEKINTTIRSKLIGLDPEHLSEIDELLIALDGTFSKSHLGANSTLGVSMAVARAGAVSKGIPLYQYLARGPLRLPMPMCNVLNGGKHADNSLDFQEFMIMPLGAPSFHEALRYATETFHVLGAVLREGGYSTAVGDEGGFAPDLPSNESACDVIMEAIRRAGYRPGEDISIALDPAASSFYEHGTYDLSRSGIGKTTRSQMIGLYSHWVDQYPIVSIEDGLAETDWDGFRDLTAKLGQSTQIVGDDLYVTNTRFIQRGIQGKCSNAVLIKLNQIGTVTETIAAISMCREAGWDYVVSHRSGETEDSFIADFTVAMGGGQIKTGSLCRGERIAKYNRLLEIEAEIGEGSAFGPMHKWKAKGRQELVV